MPITNMALGRSFTILRPSSAILEAANAASPGVAVTAYVVPNPSKILVEFASAFSGAVTLTGTDPNGAAASEVVSLTASRFGQTRARFKSITSVLVSSSAPVTLRLVGDGGERVSFNRVLLDALEGRIDRTTVTWYAGDAGDVAREQGGPHILFDDIYDYEPREGDFAIDNATGTIYRMQGYVDEYVASFRRHYEIPVQIADTAFVDVPPPPS